MHRSEAPITGRVVRHMRPVDWWSKGVHLDTSLDSTARPGAVKQTGARLLIFAEHETGLKLRVPRQDGCGWKHVKHPAPRICYVHHALMDDLSQPLSPAAPVLRSTRARVVHRRA